MTSRAMGLRALAGRLAREPGAWLAQYYFGVESSVQREVNGEGTVHESYSSVPGSTAEMYNFTRRYLVSRRQRSSIRRTAMARVYDQTAGH